MTPMNDPNVSLFPASVILATIGSPALPEVVRRLIDDPIGAEVIVIVDSPTVDCAGLLPDLADHPRLVLLQNAANIGLTRSLNKAIAHARGALIIRNDDDDVPHANRLSKIVSFFAANPGTDLVYSFASGEDEATGRTWVIDGPTDDLSIKAKLEERNFIVHSSLGFRKAALELLGFYDETYRYAQDYDLYLRAIRAGLVFGCIPEFLVRRVYHATSITVSKRRQQILYSFAARLIHDSSRPGPVRPWRTIFSYARLLIVPDWLRQLRRRVGLGR
jgi:glycosyltransferase involved in cell wall biosynthesis